MRAGFGAKPDEYMRALLVVSNTRPPHSKRGSGE